MAADHHLKSWGGVTLLCFSRLQLAVQDFHQTLTDLILKRCLLIAKKIAFKSKVGLCLYSHLKNKQERRNPL
jgi:hypothetical protein